MSSSHPQHLFEYSCTADVLDATAVVNFTLGGTDAAYYKFKTDKVSVSPIADLAATTETPVVTMEIAAEKINPVEAKGTILCPSIGKYFV